MNIFESDARSISPDAIESYEQHGFIHLRGVLDPQEAAGFAREAWRVSQELEVHNKESFSKDVFTQLVNVWQRDEAMKRLTLHPRIAEAAQKLAGISLRLWHDQTLIKQPGKSTPTEFHQDQPYWPIEANRHALTAWIALSDVPVERGCMSFIPGSHRRADIPATDLTNAKQMFEVCPELTWAPRVTVPLRAGDCTFHHGFCAHAANANVCDEPRIAHAVIFMDAESTYRNHGHVITRGMNLEAGQLLEGELFPLASHIAAN
jgi:ectoine hydroxylase-related dioxygenase (phytanoyl-CoA dioxygenase family)